MHTGKSRGRKATEVAVKRQALVLYRKGLQVLMEQARVCKRRKPMLCLDVPQP
jgi:hypothetical protein